MQQRIWHKCSAGHHMVSLTPGLLAPIWPIQTEPPVLVERHPGLMALVLNRPRVLNTLNREMIRLLTPGLEEALAAADVSLVLISGAGERGFCAGGDLKELTRAVQAGAVHLADQFFREEYALDLLIHQCPKPVVVLAHGITMGGGLGLAAGRGPRGGHRNHPHGHARNPHRLLPGRGRHGLALHQVSAGLPRVPGPDGLRARRGRMRPAGAGHPPGGLRPGYPNCGRRCKIVPRELPADKPGAVEKLEQVLAPFSPPGYSAQPGAGRLGGGAFRREEVSSRRSWPRSTSAAWSRSSARTCCRRLGERSPTALAVTLQLLRANEGRPLPEVFHREALAAHFIITHPDYLEGIRARIIDKDDQPRWQPASIEALGARAAGF